MEEGEAALEALARAFSPVGLNVLLPLTTAQFDAATAPVLPELTLATLLDGARGALIVGSGGRAFFDRFASDGPEAKDGARHPLDRFTERLVGETTRAALDSLRVRYRVYFPFDGALPLIPFQRLGRAAGLGGSSPLGLQIHPTFGPWWAYRALVVVDRPWPAGPPLGDACAGCSAPCVDACPGRAVARTGFFVPACHAHRLTAEPCRLSCAARIACVRGPDHRYRDEQLAFHMAASMPRAARSGFRP
jgi:hypothetical protein